MNFLGLDLSLTGSGIVEVDALGMATQVVRPDVPRRPPWAAYKEMRMLVGKLVQKPDRPMTAAIESPLLRGNGALERAGMWGAVVSLLGNCTVVVAPAQLKKFATGDHVAKKDKVRLAVYKRWGFEDESNDVVDAFVLAQIARSFFSLVRGGTMFPSPVLTQFQLEVLEKIRATMRRYGEEL